VKPVRKTRVNGQTKPAKHRPEPQPQQQPQQQQHHQMQTQHSEQTLNAQNLRLQNDDDDSDSVEDSDMRQRIHNWLDGVEDAAAEHPPHQEDILDEGPPQTDTAIHIVYEGD
jgi:hypothetical protein